MKIKKLITSMSMFILLGSSFPAVCMAASLDEIKQQESETNKENIQLSNKIQEALDSVNNKYQEIETLKVDINAATQKLSTLENDIAETKQNINKRKENISGRMQDIQMNQSGQTTFQVLLDSESIGDFINRAYSMAVIQKTEKEKLISLADEEAKLNQLKEDAKDTKASLEDSKSSLSTQATDMESQVSDLKETLAENQDELAKLATSRKAEESKIVRAAKAQAEATAKAKAAEQAAAKQVATEKVTTTSNSNKEQSQTTTESAKDSTSTTDSNSNTQTAPSTPAPEQPAQPETPSTGGKTMVANSTGYSYTQPGLSFYTATGLDLRQNPNVVAVDPSVIPLGTVVEVPGYGIALAADTGGDIVGNRIDVHFKTVGECMNWGRRTITITLR